MLHYNVTTSADPLSSGTVTMKGLKRSFGKAFKQDNEDVQKAASITADNTRKISPIEQTLQDVLEFGSLPREMKNPARLR